MARFDQALVRRVDKTWRRQGGRALCEVCGAQEDCDLRQALGVLGQHRGAVVSVPDCQDYMPVIGFQDRTGLEGHFNTFRRGKGWARRLHLGVRVGLFDLGADAVIGHARVTGIHTGALAELLPLHSAANHLMQSLPPQEAPVVLQKVLRRLYGTTYAALDAEFCVIDFAKEEKET